MAQDEYECRPACSCPREGLRLAQRITSSIFWPDTRILPASFFSQLLFCSRFQFRAFPCQATPLESIQLLQYGFFYHLASAFVWLLHNQTIELLDDFLVHCNSDFGFHNRGPPRFTPAMRRIVFTLWRLSSMAESLKAYHSWWKALQPGSREQTAKRWCRRCKLPPTHRR